MLNRVDIIMTMFNYTLGLKYLIAYKEYYTTYLKPRGFISSKDIFKISKKTGKIILRHLKFGTSTASIDDDLSNMMDVFSEVSGCFNNLQTLEDDNYIRLHNLIIKQTKKVKNSLLYKEFIGLIELVTEIINLEEQLLYCSIEENSSEEEIYIQTKELSIDEVIKKAQDLLKENYDKYNVDVAILIKEQGLLRTSKGNIKFNKQIYASDRSSVLLCDDRMVLKILKSSDKNRIKALLEESELTKKFYPDTQVILIYMPNDGIFLPAIKMINLGEKISQITIKDIEKLSVLSELFEKTTNLHKQGYVHCDLKTANFVVNKNEDLGLRVNMIDFDSARNIDEEKIFNSKPGVADYTFYYVSPWQYYGNHLSYEFDVVPLVFSTIDVLFGSNSFEANVGRSYRNIAKYYSIEVMGKVLNKIITEENKGNSVREEISSVIKKIVGIINSMVSNEAYYESDSFVQKYGDLFKVYAELRERMLKEKELSHTEKKILEILRLRNGRINNLPFIDEIFDMNDSESKKITKAIFKHDKYMMMSVNIHIVLIVQYMKLVCLNFLKLEEDSEQQKKGYLNILLEYNQLITDPAHLTYKRFKNFYELSGCYLDKNKQSSDIFELLFLLLDLQEFKIDIDRAKQLIEQYSKDKLFSMLCNSDNNIERLIESCNRKIEKNKAKENRSVFQRFSGGRFFKPPNSDVGKVEETTCQC